MKQNKGRWIVENVVDVMKKLGVEELDPLTTVCHLIARGWTSKSIKVNLQDAIDNVREAIRTQGTNVGLEAYADSNTGRFQLRK